MNALLTLATTLVLLGGAWGQTELSLISTGASSKIGFYKPMTLELSSERPSGLSGGPEGDGVLYGKFVFGPRSKTFTYVVALLDTDEENAVLYVDTNHDRRLTEQEKLDWRGSKREVKPREGEPYTTLTFRGAVQLECNGRNYGLSLYRFSRADEARRNTEIERILYYRDYAVTGMVKLGNEEYEVILSDDAVTGDFSVSGPDDEHVTLLFDRNGNGQYRDAGESYPANQPFNIGGTTYEVASLSPAGDRLKIRVSDKTVAEIQTPPHYGAGAAAPRFEMKAVDGKTIRFPEGYKGKIVLLDFWATWCGPCIRELPYVLEAYAQYHDKGLEIIGISLDREGDLDKLVQFTKDQKMPWPQIYDGKYWQAELAVRCGVRSIPRMFIVDGDTGKIIAEGGAIRGENLSKAIGKALKGQRP